MGSHSPAKMRSASLLLSLLLFTFTTQVFSQGTTPIPCCKTKSVTNAPAGSEDLNGEYVLKSSAPSKPEPVCADGCIYMKGNDEYCFKNVPVNEAAEVKCDQTTGATGGAHPTGGAQPTGGASGTPPAGGATTGGPQPTGGSQPAGGATGGTTLSIAAEAADANARKTKAEADIKEAESLSTELSSVTSKISSLTSSSGSATTPNTGRREKRQATMATAAPIINCADLINAIKQINTAVSDA